MLFPMTASVLGQMEGIPKQGKYLGIRKITLCMPKTPLTASISLICQHPSKSPPFYCFSPLRTTPMDLINKSLGSRGYYQAMNCEDSILNRGGIVTQHLPHGPSHAFPTGVMPPCPSSVTATFDTAPSQPCLTNQCNSKHISSCAASMQHTSQTHFRHSFKDR